MTARVLVVDDVEINVRLLTAKLASEYFEVLSADNGPAALDMVEVELPDIILLDVMMPRMDGFEVCRRLKANPHTADIPFVMVGLVRSSPAGRCGVAPRCGWSLSGGRRRIRAGCRSS